MRCDQLGRMVCLSLGPAQVCCGHTPGVTTRGQYSDGHDGDGGWWCFGVAQNRRQCSLGSVGLPMHFSSPLQLGEPACSQLAKWVSWVSDGERGQQEGGFSSVLRGSLYFHLPYIKVWDGNGGEIKRIRKSSSLLNAILSFSLLLGWSVRVKE